MLYRYCALSLLFLLSSLESSNKDFLPRRPKHIFLSFLFFYFRETQKTKTKSPLVGCLGEFVWYDSFFKAMVDFM